MDAELSHTKRNKKIKIFTKFLKNYAVDWDVILHTLTNALKKNLAYKF